MLTSCSIRERSSTCRGIVGDWRATNPDPSWTGRPHSQQVVSSFFADFGLKQTEQNFGKGGNIATHLYLVLKQLVLHDEREKRGLAVRTGSVSNRLLSTFK